MAGQPTEMKNPLVIFLSLITWAGLLIQLWLSIRLGISNGGGITRGLVGYFGYFTILTNLFVALVSTFPWLAPSSSVGKWFGKPVVFGCAVTAICGVGLAYHVLLRHVWNPQGLQWIADMILHYVVPVTALVHWIIFPPDGKVPWNWPLKWCVYPLGYVMYAMIRGEIIGSYPYYFIDAGKIGYGKVALHSLGLGVMFVVLGFAIVGIAGMRKRLNPARR